MSYHDYHRYVLLYYIYHKIRLIILEPKKLSNIAIVDTKILESISKLADDQSVKVIYLGRGGHTKHNGGHKR